MSSIWSVSIFYSSNEVYGLTLVRVEQLSASLDIEELLGRPKRTLSSTLTHRTRAPEGGSRLIA